VTSRTTPGDPLETMIAGLDAGAIGRELSERIARLYPICRSITGNGVRETLGIIGREIDLQVREVPTGTPVFDWTIPREWNIRDAYIKSLSGERIVDFHASNLHVVNYSVPVRARMSRAELESHLFSLPDRPDWIPYKTSYYHDTWGFCVTEHQRRAMRDAEYNVCIDATLEPGHLTYGECVLPGQIEEEVLFSTHICHPSLCNDNLSGISLAVTVARLLADKPHRYTYRFLFAPGTIGAIAWLALNEDVARGVSHGLVLACAGDRGRPTYKRSRQQAAIVDRAVAHVFRHRHPQSTIEDFSPYGYDERQYCSPGFNLPVGVFSRTPHGQFPEYHTSADNLDLVDATSLFDSASTLLDVIAILEGNTTYHNLNPKCEPQLGRRGLYSTMGGHGDRREREYAMLWTLNLSDGAHSLLDIAERSNLPFAAIRRAATTLVEHQLLAERPPARP